jgi:putative transposase
VAVSAKAPFAGPQQVLNYVGGYTHRVAVSNYRLLAIEDAGVQFRYEDYRRDGQQKIMTFQGYRPYIQQWAVFCPIRVVSIP